MNCYYSTPEGYVYEVFSSNGSDPGVKPQLNDEGEIVTGKKGGIVYVSALPEGHETITEKQFNKAQAQTAEAYAAATSGLTQHLADDLEVKK